MKKLVKEVKMMKKLLINVSNHPSSKWEEGQKQGWDVIIDIPFPSVDPSSSEEEVKKMASDLHEAIFKIALEKGGEFDYYVMLQGEFSLCYMTYEKLRREGFFKIALPTTSREAVEETTSTGETIKKSVFRFIRWRII